MRPTRLLPWMITLFVLQLGTLVGQVQIAPVVPQWKLIDPPNPGIITSFGLTKDVPEIVYATTYPDGAWQTLDGGANDFTWLFNGMGVYEVHTTRAVIADGASAMTRYTMVVGGGFRATLNGGMDWPIANQVGGVAHAFRPWVALTASRDDPNLVLAGGDGKIKRSPNSGANWNEVNGEPGDVIITDIEFVPQVGGQTVWASTAECSAWSEECADSFVDGRGVLCSTDAGQSWTAKLISPVPQDLRNLVYAVATIPTRAAWVIAATENGLWVSFDWGNTWLDYTPPGLSNNKILDVFYGAVPQPRLYVATEQGVLRGEVVGGAVNWFLTAFPSNVATALGTDIDDSSLLWVGYENGDIHKSTDFGVSTTRIDGAHGAYPLSSVAIKTGAESTLYSGTVCEQGIFQAVVPTPSNPTWSVLERNGNHFHYVMRVESDPVVGDTLYATENNWLWKSTDGGATWSKRVPNPPVPSGAPGAVHLHGLAVSSFQPSTLYLATGHGNWGTHPMGNPMVWRNDFGAQTNSWVNVTNNISTFNFGDTSFIDIDIHPSNSNVLYIATFGSENYPGDLSRGKGEGVLRTQDGGGTWEVINTGLTGTTDSEFVGSVAMTEVGGNLITYIATLDGLYKMTGQAGTSWTDISPGGQRRFESVAIDPTDSDVIFAGTSSPPGTDTPARIYMSTSGGSSWRRTPIEMEPRAWADQYRVRDIQIGVSRAYAVVEGSGIYMLTYADLVAYRAVDAVPLGQ